MCVQVLRGDGILLATGPTPESDWNRRMRSYVHGGVAAGGRPTGSVLGEPFGPLIQIQSL